MKKFFNEFKKFITRGNVLDLAVGVIIGGAFTGIVNGLSNSILKPLINWFLALILGAEGLTGAVTMLSTVKDETGAVDLAKSIYIDWGAFISAIINFFIVALVLFVIIRTFNRFKERNEEIKNALKKNKLTKEDKIELKKRGVKRHDFDKIKEYLAEKQLRLEAEEKAKLEAEEKARLEEANKPTVEQLLLDIKTILEKK